MEAEDLFSLGMDDWLLSEEEEETTKLLNQEEIRQLVKKEKPRNTARKTESDLNVWYRWCLTVGEKRKLEDIPAHELNNLLSNFFFTVKKRNGEEYEPNTLTSLHRSIDCHLREVGQNTICILENREFEGSRQALDAKRRQLKKRGKGGKPNASEPLSYSDEDRLWETCQLGGHSPHALNRTIWLVHEYHAFWMEGVS